ncbi:MAG: IS481 family transposase [Mycobacterium sp.]
MSKARLVITAVVLEGRSVAQVCAQYGVSRSWLYELLARYREEGDAAFEPRSRRPHTCPKATAPEAIELIVRLRKDLTQAGLDAGPATLVWHLQHHHQTRVSTATVARILTREGLITPAPKKRPKASYIRFQAEMPNQTWQSDFTHYRLTNGTDVEILTWLDDHSRYALHCSAHPRITANIVLATFQQTTHHHGPPASTLTDNGMVYTVRFASGRGGRTALEAELARLHIQQKNSRPNHPTTCGKVERFQQTLKKWLRSQPNQPHTVADLQTLIDHFIDEYNNRRPHSSLPHRATPATTYQARPKATPTTEHHPSNHHRLRHDHIDKHGKLTLRVNGKLHHIGMGRTLARTPVILLIHNLDVRIIDATTGELLRELTIDPTRDYQPTGKDRHAQWRHKQKQTEP